MRQYAYHDKSLRSLTYQSTHTRNPELGCARMSRMKVNHAYRMARFFSTVMLAAACVIKHIPVKGQLQLAPSVMICSNPPSVCTLNHGIPLDIAFFPRIAEYPILVRLHYSPGVRQGNPGRGDHMHHSHMADIYTKYVAWCGR